MTLPAVFSPSWRAIPTRRRRGDLRQSHCHKPPRNLPRPLTGSAARSRGGPIIAFSSSVLAKNVPSYGPYIASKAGVEGLVHVLANELRGHKITVNAIAPGPVGTELFLSGKTEEQIKQISSMAPLERLGQPDDIASVVSFLAGPDGGWVNAQVLRANGGFA